ncbi:galactokinase gal [Clavulina sp. PMI_390]|nr:galactokinase gal [Clavulina sp. PMI_390]
MTDVAITSFTSVSDIYDDPNTAAIQTHRWDHLISEFSKRFGRAPTQVCRAPGRVNLIGEHIDYALFGVFPAAVDRDILIACAPRSDSSEIRAQNLDGEKYAPQTFTATRIGDAAGAVKGDAWALEIDKTKLRWESYVKAGYFGVLNKFFAEAGSEPVGVDLLVTGAVPAGSGLSSSAAMVVASTLTFLAMNDKLSSMAKGDLVEMSVHNEKRVGVNSGGMDQSASVLSLSKQGLYISFYPKLAPTQIPLAVTSPATSLVIANSLVVADKVVSAKYHYNLRVVETLVGARVLAKGLGIEVGPTEKITLREVLAEYMGSSRHDLSWKEDVGALEIGLQKIDQEVQKIMGKHEAGLTFEEMVEASGLSVEDFKELYLSSSEVEATHFHLYKRTLHVFRESLRVLQFRKISLEAPPNAPDTHLRLGALLNESHASCRDLFDCSCPELDQLTHLARNAGAWGSRLTGAGWGGCSVSMVTEAEVPAFIEKISQEYPPYKGLSKEQLEQVIFATKPGSGAGSKFFVFLSCRSWQLLIFSSC